jgi:polyisoprenoid-binding protein YceI
MTTNAKAKWAIDAAHSEVQFKVKHLAISNVSGTFKIFKGEVETTGEDFNNAEINFELDVESLYTNHNERDGHLRSPLFFDAQQFPKIIFAGALKKEGNNYQLHGDLTIRDTKKPVKMDVEFTGTGKGRFGETRAGFEISGKINRKDFGLNFNMLTDAGNMIVGEEVKLHFDIELIAQAG